MPPCRILLPVALLLCLAAGALSFARAEEEPAADAVVDTSYEAPDGSHVLRQSIIVPATPEETWAIFTTAQGWKRLGIPFVVVDFRVGGLIETSYDPNAKPGLPTNIRNRILAYLPLRMLAVRAEQAPPGFPAPELLDELFSVFEFEALEGDRVRISVSGVGYREGERYDSVRRLFEQGNAWTLRKLRADLVKARAPR